MHDSSPRGKKKKKKIIRECTPNQGLPVWSQSHIMLLCSDFSSSSNIQSTQLLILMSKRVREKAQTSEEYSFAFSRQCESAGDFADSAAV